uniref:Uncharacterized protein n=1 Tax=Bionectria ochroleuca TaxID=29856 RepID=A0A0B7JQ87_BIOOC
MLECHRQWIRVWSSGERSTMLLAASLFSTVPIAGSKLHCLALVFTRFRLQEDFDHLLSASGKRPEV